LQPLRKRKLRCTDNVKVFTFATYVTLTFLGGGINFSGSITCSFGAYCSKINDYYSQCLPGSSGGSSVAPSSTLTTVARPTTSTTMAGPTSTSMRTTGTVPTSTAQPTQASGNPLAGKTFYANPYYASEILSSAVPSLSAKGSATWAAKASEVAKIGTFVWL
jgi:cellulose 1,4-beta-cellobiosidase